MTIQIKHEVHFSQHSLLGQGGSVDQILCTETDRVVALIDRVLSGPRAAPGIVC